MSLRTLFLQAPSFDGFDGGAGSRYQAKREIKSVLVSDLACPAGGAGTRLEAGRCPARQYLAWTTVLSQMADEYELCVMHTSTSRRSRVGRARLP